MGELAAPSSAAVEAASAALVMEPLELAKQVVQYASDKSAADILLLDIRRLSIIADYFVICSGDNDRQIRAISHGIIDSLEEQGVPPLHKEGVDDEQAGWALLDYGGVIVHIFSPTQRDYYRLDRLWSEAATLLRVQ